MLSTLEEKWVYKRQMNLNQFFRQPEHFCKEKYHYLNDVLHIKSIAANFLNHSLFASHSEGCSLSQTFTTGEHKAGNTQVKRFMLSVTRERISIQNTSGRCQRTWHTSTRKTPPCPLHIINGNRELDDASLYFVNVICKITLSWVVRGS